MGAEPVLDYADAYCYCPDCSHFVTASVTYYPHNRQTWRCPNCGADHDNDND